MADDYRALLDEFAHNALYNQMNKLKHTRKDYEGHRDYLIRVVVDSTTITVSEINTELTGVEFLDHLESLLNREASKAPPPVSEPVVDSRRPGTKRGGAGSSKSTSKKRVSKKSSDESMVLTTKPIPIPSMTVRNALSDERIPMPSSVPIVLYILVALSTSGTLIAGGTPSSLALALGMGFACIVPALMPQHEADLVLGLVSAVGWFIVLLAKLFELEVSGGSELSIFVLSSPWLLPVNFMLLCGGVAVFSGTPESMKWTRRMANNLAWLALALLLLTLVFANVDQLHFTVLISALLGLWSVVVLSHYRPFDVKQVTTQMALFSFLLSMVAMHSAWEYNSSIFLVLVTGLGGATIIAPNLQREIVSNWLLAFSGLGIMGLSFFITSTSGYMLPASAFLHATVLVVILGQMEMRFRQVNTSEVLVDRILASSGSMTESRTDDLSTTVAVLGFNDAGKTSFFSALWTLLDRSITKNLWYGSAKYLHDDRAIPFNTVDLKDILLEAADSTTARLIEGMEPKEVLKKYLSHRSAKISMKEEFEANRLPDPILGFPFVAEPKKQTKDFLNHYTKPLFFKERSKRQLPDATAKVSDLLEIFITFNAEMEETYPTWFGLREKTRTFSSIVRNRILSMDVPGEEVRLAVNHMSGQDIKSTDINSLLYSIDRHPEFGKHRHAIRYVVEMTARFKHVIFMVDASEFTSTAEDGKNPVGAYLLLANRLAKLRGSSLKKITILLNKSDQLLLRGEAATRNMPNGGLQSWDEVLDDDLARATLEEVIGLPTLNMISVPIDVHFACTFGGLILKDPKASDGDREFIPSFPMVPINVIEPVIRSLMKDTGRNHEREE